MEFTRTDARAVSQKDISRRNPGISMKYHLSLRVMSIFLASLSLVSPCSRIYIGFFAPLSANDIKPSRQGLQNVISRRASMTEGNRFRLCEQHLLFSSLSLRARKETKTKNNEQLFAENDASSLLPFVRSGCAGGSLFEERKTRQRSCN